MTTYQDEEEAAMRRPAIINTTADVTVICPACGAAFSGQARYNKELLRMFNEHQPCMAVRYEYEVTPPKEAKDAP